MRIHLPVLVLLGAALSSTTLLNAQDVKQTKSTRGLWDKVSSQSANVELRHVSLRMSNPEEGRQDELKKTTIISQVRGNFFLGLFNDKMMNQLIVAGSQVNDGNAAIKQRRPELYSTVTAVDTKYFSLTPYTDIYFPFDGKGTNADLGVIPQLNVKDIETVFGKLTLATRIEAEGQVSSREEDAKVLNADEEKSKKFKLVGPEKKDLDDAKSDPSYEVIYVGEAGLNLEKLVKGLSFTTWFEYINGYTPAYTLDDDGTRNKEWVTDRYVWTWYYLAYAINENLTVSNLFGTNHDGFYQAKSSHEDVYGRYNNRVMLSYKIY